MLPLLAHFALHPRRVAMGQIQSLALLRRLRQPRDGRIGARFPCPLQFFEAGFQFAHLGRFAPLGIGEDFLFPFEKRGPFLIERGLQARRLRRAVVQIRNQPREFDFLRLSEARARFMMSSGIPRRAAISRPADLPGNPTRS